MLCYAAMLGELSRARARLEGRESERKEALDAKEAAQQTTRAVELRLQRLQESGEVVEPDEAEERCQAQHNSTS